MAAPWAAVSELSRVYCIMPADPPEGGSWRPRKMEETQGKPEFNDRQDDPTLGPGRFLESESQGAGYFADFARNRSRNWNRFLRNRPTATPLFQADSWKQNRRFRFRPRNRSRNQNRILRNRLGPTLHPSYVLPDRLCRRFNSLPHRQNNQDRFLLYHTRKSLRMCAD